MSRRSTMVVRPYDPRRRLIVWVVLLLSLGIGAWQLVEYGERRAGLDLDEVRERNQQLVAQNRELEQENRDLRHRSALLNRSEEIHRQTREEVRQAMGRLQDEILELRQEVAFYRGIVSPSDAQSGIRIEDLNLRRAGPANSYYYKLVLIQALQHERSVSGTAVLTAHGKMGGEPTTLTLEELSYDGTSALNFSFRYFQDFDGMIVLPEGFVPDRIVVEAQTRGRQGQQLSREFKWSALTG